NAHDDVVVLNLLQILSLSWRLGLYDFPHARERNALRAADAVPRWPIVDVRIAVVDDVTHAQYVIRREVAPLARRLDHARGDSDRALDELGRANDGHRVAAQRHLHSAQA